MPSKPRVYLAGPDLFYPDVAVRYARLKSLCERHGLIAVIPVDNQPDFGVKDCPEARAIRRHNIDLIQSSDAVLANVTPYFGLEPDSGTAYEMGFAAACGIPVAAYCLDGLDTRTRFLKAGHLIDGDGRDDDGMLIEDFGLHANLMLCAQHPTFDTPELAVQELASTLAEFNPSTAPRDAGRNTVADLAMLLMRLAREATRDGRDSRLAAAALDYLRRHRLTGSPLRSAESVDDISRQNALPHSEHDKPSHAVPVSVDVSPRFLHVYGQQAHHDDVHIVGTVDALGHLAQTIENAIVRGAAKTADIFSSDGEGFDVVVAVASEANLSQLALPYVDVKPAEAGVNPGSYAEAILTAKGI